MIWLQLKKLEAYGFKSFAERTEVVFDQGVTAIVGPNGSGKSNISDAIRWALGEQNVRNLRGAKMEDIIFSGSSDRRAHGVAEVSLTFDNRDGGLPIDFSEVTITRRVFRSGESEYYINKAACRLKDIHDLLADTGLGREGMAVVSQHKIDELLNSRPEDRRLIFEETAGITKYKFRKREAVRKLEDTKQNLTRVADIIGELESQLEPLAESAARTKAYNALQEQWKGCQVTLLLHKIGTAQEMVEGTGAQQQSLEQEELTSSSALALRETEQERLNSQLQQLELDLQNQSGHLQQVREDQQKLEGTQAVLQERLQLGQKEALRLQDEQQQLQEQRDSLGRQNNDLEAKKLHAAQQQKQLSQEVRGAEAELYQAEQAMQDLQRTIDQSKERSMDHLHEAAAVRNQVAVLERDSQRSSQDLQRLERERLESNQGLAEVERQLTDLAMEEQTVLDNQQQLIIQSRQGQQAAGEQREALRKAEEQLRASSLRAGEMKSRRDILVHMQHEYEGFSRGIKGVLKADAPWRRGICGVVAELIEVPERVTTAVEIALGGALQNVVTEGDTEAKQAIEFLKRNHLGRVTFLPLSSIQNKGPREIENRAARSRGAIGFAAQLVQCDVKYRPVVEYLLGRTIVVEDMEAAMRIARDSAFQVRIVTLEGEYLHPGGSITGGSIQRKEASFLNRSHEIEKLSQGLLEREKDISDQERQLQLGREGLQQLRQELQTMDGLRQQTELRAAELRLQREQLGAERKRKQFEARMLQQEEEQLQQERQQLQEQLRLLATRIETMDASDVAQRERTAGWQDELNVRLMQRDGLVQQVTDRKIALSVCERDLAAYVHEHASLVEQENGLKRRQGELERSVQELALRLGETQSELATGAEKLTLLNAQRQLLEGTVQLLQEQRLQGLGAVQRTERECRDLRRRVQDLQERLHEMKLLQTKYSYELQHSRQLLQDQFHVDEEMAEDWRIEGTPAQLASRSQMLELKMEELGSVNPNAIEDYQRTQERYDFLRGQHGDLQEAQKYLAAVIKEIDATMSKQFREAFVQINLHFTEIFAKLFGGGKATLVLADPENPLESGVEIIAQPPGKKLQNLTLLSGGERALTVIAILFAILRYKPSPFIVVDEIDAALDEANVARFSDFLREYAVNTQFIIVTHRKGTMEVADVLYGVTMEQSGVSRLLSVRFEEKAG